MSAAATWPHHNSNATVLQDAIIGLCSGSDALFSMGALCKATTKFLTHLPQDSRGPPAEGLTWVSSCAGLHPCVHDYMPLWTHSVQAVVDQICAA